MLTSARTASAAELAIDTMQDVGNAQVFGEHMVFVGDQDWSIGLPDGLVFDTRTPFVIHLQVREGKALDHLDTADYKPFEPTPRG